METYIHVVNGIRIAEINADAIFITTAEDGVDLVGTLYYAEVDRIILHEKNISPAFFDLKTGIAGEILQKFSNYRMRLAIVGDFAKYPGKSIRDFIFESNTRKQINFVASLSEALEILSKN